MKIVPKLRKVKKDASYNNLKNGNCYINFGGNLCMKCDDGDQQSVNLSTGEIIIDCCDELVIPIDVEAKWSHKKTK